MPRITHGGVSAATGSVVEPVEPGTVVDQAAEVADPIVVDEHGDDAAAVEDVPAAPARRTRGGR